MARALAERGHHVEILTTDVDGAGRLPVPTGRPLEWRGVTTTFGRVGRPRRYTASPGLWQTLRHRIREFDIVHVHNLYLFPTLVAGHYCRRLGVPYLVSTHGTLDLWHRSRHRWRKAVYTRLLEGRNLHAAAAIHYTSVAERDHAAGLGLPTTGFVVPHGVNTESLARPAEAASLFEQQPALAGRELVTFVGRLTRKKRLDLLLDGFATVARDLPNAHLVIAGPDDEGIGRALRARIAKHALERRVTLLGLVVGDLKVALLQRSRVFVLPSEDESFGVAVVEAMAAGLPVIVTEGVAIAEALARVGAGQIVTPTPAALSATIGRLLTDKELAASMGENGRALAGAAFAWGGIAVELEDMYEQVLGRRIGRT
jgi:glycosyltransferase involved in cell wall biosynthesis